MDPMFPAHRPLECGWAAGCGCFSKGCQSVGKCAESATSCGPWGARLVGRGGTLLDRTNAPASRPPWGRRHRHIDNGIITAVLGASPHERCAGGLGGPDTLINVRDSWGSRERGTQCRLSNDGAGTLPYAECNQTRQDTNELKYDLKWKCT